MRTHALRPFFLLWCVCVRWGEEVFCGFYVLYNITYSCLTQRIYSIQITTVAVFILNETVEQLQAGHCPLRPKIVVRFATRFCEDFFEPRRFVVHFECLLFVLVRFLHLVVSTHITPNCPPRLKGMDMSISGWGIYIG